VLKAYADEHVVFAIVRALRARGMDVVTVQERGRQSTADAVLLADALAEQRVVLTNDHHFLVLAAHNAARAEAFAPIFYWSQQRRKVGEVVRRIIREASQEEYSSLCSQVVFF
jgi:5'-3' exonuclease